MICRQIRKPLTMKKGTICRKKREKHGHGDSCRRMTRTTGRERQNISEINRAQDVVGKVTRRETRGELDGYDDSVVLHDGESTGLYTGLYTS